MKPQAQSSPTPQHSAGLFRTDGTEYDPYVPAQGIPLPADTFVVRVGPQRGFYLSKVQNIPVPRRVYGQSHAERIVKAYHQRAAAGASTGVWLNGEKGSGKTMLAAVLAAELRGVGIPTILVQDNYTGPAFNSFIEHLGTVCMIFDEFEKMYEKDEDKNAMLTVFAGAVITQNLYVLTTNQAYKVTDAMRNRPSRMRYFIDYRGVPKDVVEDYLAQNLKDQTAVPAVIAALAQINECNFDIMMCAVEEHNRFGGKIEDILSIMNISRGLNQVWHMTYRGAKSTKPGADSEQQIVGKGRYNGDLLDQLECFDRGEDFAWDFDYIPEGTSNSEEVSICFPAQPIVFNAAGNIVLKSAGGEVVLRRSGGFSTYRQKF